MSFTDPRTLYPAQKPAESGRSAQHGSPDDAHLALAVPPFDHSGDVVNVAGHQQGALVEALGDMTPRLLEPHPQHADVVRSIGQPDSHRRLSHGLTLERP